MERILDLSTLALWSVITIYFAHRYFVHTRKLVTIALSVMCLSCAMVSISGVLDKSAYASALLRGMFLGNALFIGISIIRVHRTGR